MKSLQERPKQRLQPKPSLLNMFSKFKFIRKVFRNKLFIKVIIVLAFLSGVLLLFLCASANMELDSFIYKSDDFVTQNLTVRKHKDVLCSINLKDHRSNVVNREDQAMIYFVTPTYPRPAQVPELVRLGHTLMHVPRLHWIVADDHYCCSEVVADILRQTGLPFTHIASPKPERLPGRTNPRGVANRRAALAWIKKNVKHGILYFGDDDNTFDLKLFDEIRQTKKVSMFPVGLIGEYGVSSPVVKDGKVAGFFDSWPGSRTFAVDMAGFAVNVHYIKPESNMPYITGHEEDKFLRSLGLQLGDIEPLADNCSKIFVWHTRTDKAPTPKIRFDIEKLKDLDNIPGFVGLIKQVLQTGLATIFSNIGKRPKIYTNNREYDPLNAF